MTNWIRGLALLASFFTTVLAGPVGAGDAQPSAEARALLSRQFDAFARDDAAGAYALVTPALKMTFTDPDVFMGMVRNRYAPVYRHRSFEFGEAKSYDGKIYQQVHIIDASGDAWEALYTLEPQPDGTFKISGCVLKKAVTS